MIAVDVQMMEHVEQVNMSGASWLGMGIPYSWGKTHMADSEVKVVSWWSESAEGPIDNPRVLTIIRPRMKGSFSPTIHSSSKAGLPTTYVEPFHDDNWGYETVPIKLIFGSGCYGA